MNQITFRRRWLAVSRILVTATLIGTMAFIFSNSLAPADVSNAASDGAQQQLYTLLDKVGLPGLEQLLSVHVIRKLAHFAEYALLGFWWALCLWVYTRRAARHLSGALLACLLTALADETLQTATSGRSGQLSDVWLDFAGALSGLACGFLLLWLCRRWISFVKKHDKE